MSLEHILLGMLEQPASGYALKQAFDEGAKYFWSAELSQIYPTLKRMQRRGWLARRTEPSGQGPPRHVYRRTPAGTRELDRWLKSEPILGTERFAYIGQLIFMGRLADLRHTHQFLRTLQERLSSLHDLLVAAQSSLAGDQRTIPQDLKLPELHEWICVGMGIASLRAKILWCDQVRAHLSKRMKPKRNAAGSTVGSVAKRRKGTRA